MQSLPQREELVNALTHGAGIVAGLAGGAALITLTAVFGDAKQIVAASVFVTAMVLLYTASTLYHAVRHERIKGRLKILDHCAIFIMIAGTYTPFTLISLGGSLGWTLFAVVWTLAVAGIIFKLFFTGRFQRLSTFIYLAMGWLMVVAILPLSNALETWTLIWLFGGGLAYTVGTVFYHRPEWRYSHAVWHGFVLLGTAAHFVAVSAAVLSD